MSMKLANLPMHPGYVAGNYYNFPFVSPGAGGVSGSTVFRIMPFYLPFAVTISELGARVNTLYNGGNFQIAIYALISATNPLPGTLIDHTGNLSTTNAVVVTGALGVNQTLLPGWYWLAYQMDNATAILQSNTIALLAWVVGDAAAANVAIGSSALLALYTVTNTFGSWPSDLTGASLTDSNSTTSFNPIFKVASVP